MRAVKSVSIDSARRVIITYLDGSTETLYPNCIWCDSEALRELIKDLLEEKADAITQTIENVTVASFADGADEGLIKKLLVSIEPIQEGSGDPSPENVRPISGRTGVNVSRTGFNQWNEEWEKGGINASSGMPANVSNRIRSKNFSPCWGGVKYYVHIEFDVQIRIFWYDSDRNYIAYQGGQEFVATSPNNARYFKISVENNTYGETYRHDICVNLSDPTKNGTYEPYKGSTYSVNWETEAGTVYGGYVDVVSGKLTVDRAIIDLGNLSWNYEASIPRFYSTGINTVVKKVNNDSVANCVSSMFKAVSFDELYLYSKRNGTMCVNNAGTLSVINNAYSDPVSFRTAMSGVQLVYELAIPTEIQLTPQEIRTLLGENNIWADSGNILELEYTADTKLYISEQRSGTSGALGSGRQEIVNHDIQTVSEKTLEDVEAYKEDTDERGEK